MSRPVSAKVEACVAPHQRPHSASILCSLHHYSPSVYMCDLPEGSTPTKSHLLDVDGFQCLDAGATMLMASSLQSSTTKPKGRGVRPASSCAALLSHAASREQHHLSERVQLKVQGRVCVRSVDYCKSIAASSKPPSALRSRKRCEDTSEKKRVAPLSLLEAVKERRRDNRPYTPVAQEELERGITPTTESVAFRAAHRSAFRSCGPQDAPHCNYNSHGAVVSLLKKTVYNNDCGEEIEKIVPTDELRDRDWIIRQRLDLVKHRVDMQRGVHERLVQLKHDAVLQTVQFWKRHPTPTKGSLASNFRIDHVEMNISNMKKIEPASSLDWTSAEKEQVQSYYRWTQIKK